MILNKSSPTTIEAEASIQAESYSDENKQSKKTSVPQTLNPPPTSELNETVANGFSAESISPLVPLVNTRVPPEQAEKVAEIVKNVRRSASFQRTAGFVPASNNPLLKQKRQHSSFLSSPTLPLPPPSAPLPSISDEEIVQDKDSINQVERYVQRDDFYTPSVFSCPPGQLYISLFYRDRRDVVNIDC